MKHNTLSDCLSLLCVAALVTSIACNKNVRTAQYLEAADCQYHVLKKAFENNAELIDQVLEVGQGPYQVEEFVDVATQLGKTDVDIVTYGKALNECLPVELRAEQPILAPPPAYGNKIVSR